MLYNSSMTLISEKKSEKAIPVLEQIINKNPDFKDSYKYFSDLCFFYKKHKLLIKSIQKLMQRYPQNGKYYLDLARSYFRSGKSDLAESVLTDSAFLNSNYSRTSKKLLQAKLCFSENQNRQGQIFYIQAINSIKSAEDDALVFQDIIYIISDEQYSRYDTTALQNRPRFYQSFWRKRDPTPFSYLNERIPEHFRRLFYARKYYRKYFTVTNLDNPALYFDESLLTKDPDPSKIILKQGLNPFKQLNLPRGMREQEDIDDRGYVYLHHGEPNDMEIQDIIEPHFDLILATKTEHWQYFAKSTRPEALYFFLIRQGCARLLAAPLTIKNLKFLNPGFANFNFSTYQEFVVTNKQIVEEHIILETTEYKYSPKTFDFPYTLVSFKNKQNMNSLEVYYGVPLKEFKPDKNEPQRPIQIEKGFALFDQNWEVIDRWQEANQFETQSKKDDWKEILYLNGRQYRLPPGEYHFALQLDDPVSGKMALYRGDYSLSDYFIDSLQLSKIILAKNLQPENAQSLFAKDGVQFTPKFNGVFPRQEPIALYYEIYNLCYDTKGQTKYEITYSVWPYKKEKEITNPRRKKPIIRTGTTQNGQKRDEKVWMSFDFSNQKKGKYVIEILVQDRESGEEARKLIPVEVK